MASRQTDKYGNPVHHTAATGQGVPLGAPGTTGAVETHDPLGAPGSTGASPTTGYGAGAGAGGQEQLHRPTGGGTTGTHGTTAQGYAYGTAASMGHAGHAGVAVPHTTGVTSGYDTGAHRTGGTGQGTHGVSGAHAGYDTGAHKSTDIGYTAGGGGGHVGGYDTGSFGGGTDIGHTGGVGQRTTHERGQVGGYDTGAGDKTSSHELGGQKGGYDTGGGRAHGQGLGGGDWARSRGVQDQHGSDKTHGGGGYDTGGNKTHGQGMEGHGGGYESFTSAGDPLRGGVSATVVEVVTEEPIREEEGKGIIDKIMEHLPGSGGGGTK